MNRIVFNLLLVLASTLFTPLWAAPSAQLWERWSAHNADSTQTIDHGIWQQILGRYVIEHRSGINRFAYKAVSEGDRDRLNSYLAALGDIKISQYNRDQQRAYWINVYNALTVEEILNFYPLQSIRDISSGFFSSGPWGKELITVEGQVLTLDDIEHRILRPIWQDARLHYAVNCASLGCPNLQAQAFTAQNTEAMLDKGAVEFVNHERGARVDSSGDLQVSSLYTWFADDFGGETGVIKHLQQYAKPALAAVLKDITEIDDDAYDWSLNALSPDQAKMDKARKIGS